MKKNIYLLIVVTFFLIVEFEITQIKTANNIIKSNSCISNLSPKHGSIILSDMKVSITKKDEKSEDNTAGKKNKVPAAENVIFCHSPLWSPVGKRIAFFIKKHKKTDLWIVNSDGSEKKNLTENLGGCINSDFSWSPDGKKLLFIFEVGLSGGDICVMNPDGSNKIIHCSNLKYNSIKYSPSWSPDSAKILFASSNTKNLAYLCITDLNGDYQRKLANCVTFPFWSTWSPNGNKIAFYTEKDQKVYLFLINPDGTNKKELSKDFACFIASGFSWSPVGDKIVYATQKNEKSNLWVINSDGRNRKKLTEDFSGCIKGRISWSQNGSKIAFLSEKVGKLDLWVINPDGSERTNVTKDIKGLIMKSFFWSSVGKRIAFFIKKHKKTDLWIVNSDGSEKKNLTEQLSGSVNGRISWSPNGDNITFVLQNNKSCNLFIINNEGKECKQLTNFSIKH